MTFTVRSNSLKNIDTSDISVKYQWVYNLTAANTVEFDPLTFPSIKKRWQGTKQRGYLGGVAAFVAEEMVGLILVELLPKTAEIISFFVTPQYRHQGIGNQLLQNLEKALIKLKYPQIKLKYRVSGLTASAL